MYTTEQSMIEARRSSVASFKAAGTAGAKGRSAEGYPDSCTDMPGPGENIRRTVTQKGGELSDPTMMSGM